MRFMCDKKAMLTKLGYVLPYTDKQNITTSLVNIELGGDKLSLRSMNGTTWVETSIVVIGEVDGSCLVRGKLLSSMISSMENGDVQFSGKKRLHISRGEQKHSVATASPDDIPPPPRVGSSMQLSFSADMLIDALTSVSFAAADSTDPRMILQGVCFNEHQLVATDGYRIAAVSIGQEVSQSFVLPIGAIRPLIQAMKMEDAGTIHIQCTPDHNWIELVIGDTAIRTAALSGEFPLLVLRENQEKLRQKSGKFTVEIERNLATPILKIANTLANAAKALVVSQAMALHIDENMMFTMEVSSVGGMCRSIGYSLLDGEKPEDFHVLVSPTFLLRIIQIATSEKVCMTFWDVRSPFLVHCGNWSVIQTPMVVGSDSDEVPEVKEDEEDEVW